VRGVNMNWLFYARTRIIFNSQLICPSIPTQTCTLNGIFWYWYYCFGRVNIYLIIFSQVQHDCFGGISLSRMREAIQLSCKFGLTPEMAQTQEWNNQQHKGHRQQQGQQQQQTLLHHLSQGVSKTSELVKTHGSSSQQQQQPCALLKCWVRNRQGQNFQSRIRWVSMSSLQSGFPDFGWTG